MRLLWYASAFIQGPVRSRDTTVTTARHLAFERMAQEVVRSMGVPVVDILSVTQSQWGNAFDGVHYMTRSGDEWLGRVSYVAFQVALNALFPSCTGT